MRISWPASVKTIAAAAIAACMAPPAAAHDSRWVQAGSNAAGARVRRLVYQGRDRGPEQTERITRRVKLARNGSVTLTNVADDVIVTGGPGAEVSIEAMKRTHGGRGDLGSVIVDINEGPGRVDIRTRHTARNDHVRVDYTITMPDSASLDVHSVSGHIKVTSVRGTLRAETVSGGINTSGTPRLAQVKSVSGDIDVTDAGNDGSLAAHTVSGRVRINGLKSRDVEIKTVSGPVILTSASSERLDAHSVSGTLEYNGALARNGRYELQSFSGSVRLVVSDKVGFELDAGTFSGSIRSDLPLTIRGGTEIGRRHGSSQVARGTFGDGSAVVKVRTFSGSVTIAKQ